MSVWTPFLKEFVAICKQNKLSIIGFRNKQKNPKAHIFWDIDNCEFKSTLTPINSNKSKTMILDLNEHGQVIWSAKTVFDKTIKIFTGGDNCFI